MTRGIVPVPTRHVALALGALCVVALVTWWLVLPRLVHGARHVTTCTSCGNKPGMLPVMDPLHNVEQAYTNLALLEDHMLPGKTCEDCCLKHFRLISGLLDEGISLDTHDAYGAVLATATVEIRRIEDRFFQGSLSPTQTAKRLRALRKQLTPLLKERYGASYNPPTTAGACGAQGCSARPPTSRSHQ